MDLIEEKEFTMPELIKMITEIESDFIITIDITKKENTYEEQLLFI